MFDRLPVIALTTGDPAGVGPEIVVKALAEGSWLGRLVPIVIGDAPIVEQAVEASRLAVEVRAVTGPEELSASPGVIDVLDCGVLDAVTHGVVDAAAGRAAITYIERASELARNGHVHGLVTGPINKESIWAAGSPFPGHTEMLAHLFDVPEQDALTMFMLGSMKIFFLTRHHSLRDAVEKLDEDMVARFLCRVREVMGDLGVTDPYLALAALNPHGGENGKLGLEEHQILEPGIAKARDAGVNVVGPVPADAVFHQALQGKYDGVIALYHDQGHIAAKTVDFFGTVACELGLPVIRTTVDHGTAFDIAGTWQADPRGQTAALLAAADLARLIQASRSKADHRNADMPRGR